MFCKYCGKQIKDGSCYCTYCCKSLTTLDATSDDTPITYTKSPNRMRGVIIASIILIVVLSAVGVSFYHYNNTDDDALVSKVEEHIDDDTSSHKSSHKSSDSHSHDDEDQVDAKDSKSSIKSSKIDMSRKTLYYTYDGYSAEDSYWEFKDNHIAKLVFSDGGYLLGNYTVMSGAEGMAYTANEFPEYGLTMYELEMTVAANRDSYYNFIDYVVVVFEDLVEYDSDDNIVTEYPGNSLYYGGTFEEDEGIVYELVGANSADYYYFIEFKDETI